MPAPEDDPILKLDPSTRLQLAEVDLGLALEDFVKSKVGRYLLGRAQGEADLAMEKLKKVDPSDSKTITVLQNDIWRADAFGSWIAQAIMGGKNAESQVKRDEDEAEDHLTH